MSQLSDPPCTNGGKRTCFTRVVDDVEGGSRSSLSQQRMLPVVFGRPDFQKELEAVGNTYLNEDVNVYVCGNTALVDTMKKACEFCDNGNRSRFHLSHERFG